MQTQKLQSTLCVKKMAWIKGDTADFQPQDMIYFLWNYIWLSLKFTTFSGKGCLATSLMDRATLQFTLREGFFPNAPQAEISTYAEINFFFFFFLFIDEE